MTDTLITPPATHVASSTMATRIARVAAQPLTPVSFDLYRDIHKGIRAELFAVTGDAGRLDPVDRLGRASLADHVRSVIELLVHHAEHEDGVIAPVMADELPELAAVIESDHEALEARMDVLAGMADELVGDRRTGRHLVHAVYLELASFTSYYLRHQDTEERVVMPALEAAIGPDACRGLHGAIVGSIPPDELMRTLALMIPAMNLDDRTELVMGLRAGAPAGVADAVLGLAGSVLSPADHAALVERLDR